MLTDQDSQQRRGHETTDDSTEDANASPLYDIPISTEKHAIKR